MMALVTCRSPIDDKVIAERPTMSAAEITAAIDAARTAQSAWARVSIADRAAHMMRFLEALREANPEVVKELALQMGRPVLYGGEFRSLEERVKYMVSIAETALAPVRPEPKAGFKRWIERAPVGVILTIAPWNYPYLTAVNTVVPALMAGNAVLLKAASQTLLTGDRFQAAFAKAGLPAGLFRTLTLSHEDTARVISSGMVNHIAFTGSVEGGRTIERAAAGTFTTMGLELGGKDPAYVRADANIEHAIETLVDGAFFNTGQSCCGIERIYVAAQHYDRFVEGFVALTKAYVLGDPLDEATTLGPMAAPRFANAVREHITAATKQGATALIDPAHFKRHSSTSAWLAPQVLTGVDHTMAVMMQETFGPVAGIMKVRDDAEAVRLMNDSPYGLTASIWTTDLDAAEHLGQQIDTGTVFANRCDYLDPALAWTGVKDTGRGASLSSIGYDMLTRPKSYHLRTV
jgi:acyl-CoA reductase-like NAD-dependent aldehyde dehydrogenase